MPSLSPEEIERRVDLIEQMGYYTYQFSEYHFRVEDSVDFWPTSCKWFDRKGYKYESRGCGLKALQAYLIENYPLPPERKPEDA